MDPMCMEAALSLSSPVAVSSTLNSQADSSPPPEGGVSVIVPDSVTGLIQSSAPMVQGGKSFAGLFKSCPVETLPVSSVLSKKGGYEDFFGCPNSGE
ncbi:hypothetical protein LWI29_009038 [Acer saccharum]|uniref:Uncharacterized protein n=1 Tax=Acer saccharum TaxID=4024 RepID=A0AA39SC50_ACESA|nr:hypothetical protein LWI29_009038 [Acer saccharum]